VALTVPRAGRRFVDLFVETLNHEQRIFCQSVSCSELICNISALFLSTIPAGRQKQLRLCTCMQRCWCSRPRSQNFQGTGHLQMINPRTKGVAKVSRVAKQGFQES